MSLHMKQKNSFDKSSHACSLVMKFSLFIKIHVMIYKYWFSLSFVLVWNMLCESHEYIRKVFQLKIQIDNLNRNSCVVSNSVALRCSQEFTIFIFVQQIN